MPDEGKNFGGSFILDFKIDDVTCKPRICSLAPQSLRFGWFLRFCFRFSLDHKQRGRKRNLEKWKRSDSSDSDSARDSNSEAMVWAGNSASGRHDWLATL